MTQHRRDVITILTDDHRAVELVFQELESRQGSPRHRWELTNYVIAELVRHSVAEQRYLCPTVRKVLPDGDRLAYKEIDEYAEAERIMNDLDGMDPTEAGFDATLGRLIRAIRRHVVDEESVLFPRLRAACAESDLVDLGGKVVLAKQMALIRPHHRFRSSGR